MQELIIEILPLEETVEKGHTSIFAEIGEDGAYMPGLFRIKIDERQRGMIGLHG
ncbi:MAG: hypothetical protein AAF824_21035 [Bacteroidota bacterium]